MNRSTPTRGAFVAATAGLILITGCGGGSTASGSGNKSQICNQFKTLNDQLNKETAPTDNSTAISQITDAQGKVQALAQQSNDSKLSADLTTLAHDVGQVAAGLKAGNSGAASSASSASNAAVKTVGTDCNMNFSSGSTGSTGSSGTSTTSGGSGSNG